MYPMTEYHLLQFLFYVYILSHNSKTISNLKGRGHFLTYYTANIFNIVSLLARPWLVPPNKNIQGL